MNRVDAPTERQRATRRRTLLAIAMAGAVLGVIWWSRPDPERLLEQGLAAIDRDPPAAERLFRSAGANFPDARAGLCGALARQGNWEEARHELAALDLSRCRSDVLIAFGPPPPGCSGWKGDSMTPSQQPSHYSRSAAGRPPRD